jgi:hypothetical protein
LIFCFFQILKIWTKCDFDRNITMHCWWLTWPVSPKRPTLPMKRSRSSISLMIVTQEDDLSKKRKNYKFIVCEETIV